jgi:hypothetical protein
MISSRFRAWRKRSPSHIVESRFDAGGDDFDASIRDHPDPALSRRSRPGALTPTSFALVGIKRQSVASLRNGLPVTPSKIIWHRLSRVKTRDERTARRWVTGVLSAQLRKFGADVEADRA